MRKDVVRHWPKVKSRLISLKHALLSLFYGLAERFQGVSKACVFACVSAGWLVLFAVPKQRVSIISI